jgi:N utilization substance protein B
MSEASGRHLARQWAVQFLFQLDFNEPDEFEEDLQEFWAGLDPAVSMRTYTEGLIQGVMEHKKDIDTRLVSYANNWKLSRFNAVDRNVLRLALYELFFLSDVPPVVVVDEAITLAKEMSSDESGKFVNGLLDRALKDVDRPLRSAQE